MSSISESQLWAWMMDGNYPPGYPDFRRPELCKLDRRAFATLSKDVVFRRWRGHDRPEKIDTIPAGTRIKAVMASRLGDVGITDDLKAHNGYHCRITCVESEFAGQTFLPEGILVDIEPVEDGRADKVKLAFPDGAKLPQDYTRQDI